MKLEGWSNYIDWEWMEEKKRKGIGNPPA